MLLETLIRFFDIFTAVTVVFIIFYFIYLIQEKWFRILKLALSLPGPFAYPFIGNAFNFACKPEDLLDRAVKTVKPYINLTPIRLWMGPMLCVIITKPSDLEIILNSQQANNKGFSYQFLKPFIGEGLISGAGPIWKSHRRIVAPILTQKILDEFLEVFDRQSRNLMRELKTSTGKVINILGPVELCTANIVCETVMGLSDVEALIDSNKEFLHYSAEMYRVVHDRIMKIWLYPDWIYQFTENYKIHLKGREVLGNFVEKSIADLKTRRSLRKSELKNSILNRILDTCEKSENKMNDEELKDEMITIYLAAQDTLAVISSFAILMLAIHQDIQNQARNEVLNIIATSTINAEKLSKLKYIEKIVKETLRLFPIAPIMARTTTGEIKLDSCTVPEYCQLILVPFLTHRNPEYFPEPEIFDPERFSRIETAKRHPYSFIPFSAGPMGCIGQRYAMMSLKTMISNFLRNYKVTSNVKMQEISLKTDISIRSRNGYQVNLESL